MPAWWHMLVILSVALWIGPLVFFSFMVAPTVFQSLDMEQAAKFMRMMFPRYYAFQVVVVVALTGFVAVAAGTGKAETVFHTGRGAVVPVFIGFLCAMLGRRWLTPRVNEARDLRAAAKPDTSEFAEAQKQFSRYHRISVQVNLLAILSAITFTVFYALASAPRMFGPAGLGPFP